MRVVERGRLLGPFNRPSYDFGKFLSFRYGRQVVELGANVLKLFRDALAVKLKLPLVCLTTELGNNPSTSYTTETIALLLEASSTTSVEERILFLFSLRKMYPEFAAKRFT